MPRPELRCFGDRLTKHNASTRYGLPRGRLDNGKGRVGTALAVKQCSVPALVLFSPHGYDRCKFLLENYAPFRSPLCQIETADRAINCKENFTFISHNRPILQKREKRRENDWKQISCFSILTIARKGSWKEEESWPFLALVEGKSDDTSHHSTLRFPNYPFGVKRLTCHAGPF